MPVKFSDRADQPEGSPLQSFEQTGVAELMTGNSPLSSPQLWQRSGKGKNSAHFNADHPFPLRHPVKAFGSAIPRQPGCQGF